MEEIVQIISENCACFEARAINLTLQHENIINKYTLKMKFSNLSNRTVYPFGVTACRTNIFNVLKDPKRLSGFKIGGDYYYLKWYSKYRRREVQDGMMVEVNHLKRVRNT